MTAPRYVIYTPSYSPLVGGPIVQHKLCHTLNKLGENAVVCHMPAPNWGGRRRRLMQWLKPRPFATSPDLDTPVMRERKARPNDIVLYPELAGNNPLRARNVVHWLLNRPSFHDRTVHAGPRDLFFKYDDRCDEPELTKGKAQTLFLFTPNPSYRQTNHGPRSGSCYMIRKAKGQPLVHDLTDSLLVDDVPHKELNVLFNQRKTFYCYDEMSSYSQFAALCGCISVVIPWHFKDQADFIANYPLSRYGVAYGEENIPHALATMHLVEGYLKDCEQSGIQSVRDFISVTRRQFGFPAATGA